MSHNSVKILQQPLAAGVFFLEILLFFSQPNGLKTKTAPQTGTEVTAVVGDTFFNIIIIPMEPYQPNGWKTGIRSTDLQFGLCGSGRKN